MIHNAFIKINGIDGESKDLLHHGEIDVIRWRWNVGAALSKNNNILSGNNTVNGFVFEHYIDKSSQGILHYFTSGRDISEVVLTIKKSDGAKLECLQIMLQEVVITNIQPICYNTMRTPREKVELLYSRFTMDYVSQDKQGFTVESLL